MVLHDTMNSIGLTFSAFKKQTFLPQNLENSSLQTALMDYGNCAGAQPACSTNSSEVLLLIASGMDCDAWFDKNQKSLSEDAELKPNHDRDCKITIANAVYGSYLLLTSLYSSWWWFR